VKGNGQLRELVICVRYDKRVFERGVCYVNTSARTTTLRSSQQRMKELKLTTIQPVLLTVTLTNVHRGKLARDTFT
jgi:hypothetical protein